MGRRSHEICGEQREQGFQSPNDLKFSGYYPGEDPNPS